MKLKRWDAKSVARETHEERYEEIKAKLLSDGTEWKNLHRKTIAKLWDELTTKEQTNCEEKAASWNCGQLTEEEKRK